MVTKMVRTDQCFAPSDREIARRERAISWLSRDTSAPRDEVRRLFLGELSRLEEHATVRNYLHVLALASVRRQLRNGAGGRK